MSSKSCDAQSGVEGDIVTATTDERTETRHLRFKPMAFAGIIAASVGIAGYTGYTLGNSSSTGDSATGRLLTTTAHGEALAYQATTPNHATDQTVISDYQARLSAMLAEQQRLRAELERVQNETADGSKEELASLEALAEAQRQLSELRLELAAAESAREGMNQTLGTLAGTMEQVISERDDAAAKAETLDEQVTALSVRQEEKIRVLENAARISLDGMRGMFERTGLDLDSILDETREDYTGEGGPFEYLPEDSDVSGDASDQTSVRVAALMSDLEEVNLMRFAAQRLPLGEPVKNARMTSHFGPRRDPLGRGRALHKGLDYAGPKGTPILATADGVVTFSGRQRGYGKIVTIQHAFGIETRYAHLNSIKVKVGERVERGDRIGGMGNTGRSTGTHLHYEIRIDREAVNPATFIEASHDVL